MEERYEYEVILEDGSEITLFLKGLDEEQIAKLDDGDDTDILGGGGFEAFYVLEEYVDSIELWDINTKKTHSISYEEYRAKLN